jgi:hypothetical protein
VIAERLSGQGPFVATDPFMKAELFDDLNVTAAATPEPVLDPPPPPLAAPPPAPTEPPPPVPTKIRVLEPDIPLRPRTAEPDIPLKPRTPPPAEPSGPTKNPGADVDLTDVLSGLEGRAAPPAPTPPPSRQNLDAVFGEFRSEVSRRSGANEAAEYLGLAKTYLEMGMTDEAMQALATAARAPSERFEAASLLGRLYLKNNDLPHAVEWLERAAEAPAPGVKEARELLYELGSILETCGETARALAVFLELQADAGEYRDVAGRVERLARVQAGG